MHVKTHPKNCLLIPTMDGPNHFKITYGEKSIRIPFAYPTDNDKERILISMHQSKVLAYTVSAEYDEFFSNALETKCRLVYLGGEQGNFRPALGNAKPSQPDMPGSLGFADAAGYLVTSQASLENLQSKLNRDLDIIPLRTNIHVEGMDLPYEEDFWSEISICDETGKTKARILLNNNCGRCSSINITYNDGVSQAKGMQPLKALMADRRVDKGLKYSPIFGRYGFSNSYGAEIKVGDIVRVTKINKERTIFYWPGLSSPA